MGAGRWEFPSALLHERPCDPRQPRTPALDCPVNAVGHGAQLCGSSSHTSSPRGEGHPLGTGRPLERGRPLGTGRPPGVTACTCTGPACVVVACGHCAWASIPRGLGAQTLPWALRPATALTAQPAPCAAPRGRQGAQRGPAPLFRSECQLLHIHRGQVHRGVKGDQRTELQARERRGRR